MESEKVKEIKKALEQNDDNGIMYEVNDQKRTCKFIHHKDILTLINEFESENERLMKLQARGGCRVAELGIENQQLKDRIAELEKEGGEQLKQFAERLIEKKVKLGERFNIYDIDETLKECLCDNNQ